MYPAGAALFLLISMCLVAPGCAPSSPPAEETSEAAGSESEEVLLMMYGNPRVAEDGYPEPDAEMTRVDFPALEDALEVFDQLAWTDVGSSPHMAFSRTHPDGLNLERPADQHDSDIILAEWHSDPDSRYATLDSEQQARQLVESWYNKQDLTDLADWKTAEELDQELPQ